MTQMMTDFVPAEFDVHAWEVAEPLYADLRDRPVDSAADFERWLLDRSELDAAVSESAARRYINMTCDTADKGKEKAYLDFVENVMPKLKPASFELDKRQASLAEAHKLPEQRYRVLERDVKAGVELYRDENVPIQTELAKLSQQHDALTGAMTVQFDGEEKTLPQMGVYQESADRDVRERAWKTVAQRRLKDADAISATYDQMIAKRHRMAQNAGFDNFVGYAFKAMGRFDYTPELCFAFHDAIEKRVMPFVERLDAKRRAQLGVDSLRPWDLGVDPKGRPPLKPFAGGKDLVSKTRDVFDRLSPELGAMFSQLGDGSNDQGISTGHLLDLDTRKGKAPGGYQYMQDRSRVPFIFMNAAGLHRDVETMVHEAGHAFHSMLCTDEPLVHYRESPIEFAEVASMTMELLTMPYWDAYYPSREDADRARRKQLEGSIGLLPWIATIDAFQHQVYSKPAHTRDERQQMWLGLEDRFGLQGHRVNWAGLEDNRPYTWQSQGHLFGVPFYYIEYGIAQLGALGLWLKSLEEGEGPALAAYKKALSLGGSRPLPELFAAADLPFDFGDATVARLVERVEAELEKLPE
ncbi:MAG: oligoendopeptidase F [Phycisphaeraceae bacterium]|nr:MAG: oligoendopeptidase F [Phycisphaeraceae bacterium]